MRHFSSTLILILLLFGNINLVLANTEALPAFQNYKKIGAQDITVPTVVEVPFDSQEKIGYDLAVLETETNAFEPWYLKSDVEEIEFSAGEPALLDKNTKTYTEYEVPMEGKGIAEIVLIAEEAVRASGLSLFLDRYVSRPTHITIETHDDEGIKTVLSRGSLMSTTVNFPETKAKVWVIRLEYSQLLRISEIELEQIRTENDETKSLRFLAKPDTSYTIYFNADRPVNIVTGESGDLKDDEGIKILAPVISQPNPLYVKEDSDEDGIPDESDNCVSVSNPDQTDLDENGRGDECDDYDRDDIMNFKDNCPEEPNKNQSDEDEDGIGDLCDGEESRFTEQNPWLPWAGMGVVVMVIFYLFFKTARQK